MTMYSRSRFTTGAESRYALVEGAVLALALVLQKTGTSRWEKTRLQCGVTTKVVHLPGNDHNVADAMSRYPVAMPKEKAGKT